MAPTATASPTPANATPVGQVNTATSNNATADATNTDNAKTELASASPDGTANIARWKDARTRVPLTDSADSIRTARGSADVRTDGTEETAASCWSKAAAMAKITIKVSISWSCVGCSSNNALFSDGLVDCEDPECCANPLCRSSQLCVSSPKPIDILLRKQPPAITASFFERMKFLIDEGSLQNYARQETFNER